ncbi:UDP-N-acetyl-D-mannosamine dehydrogenase [Arthrobacter tumbae]|uniref:UDP-N-acetyl-D-mannosamine dehydrogenase n=1 Tax=Arthrobacter tumbae TaxID=163874 RepID=UPI00195AF261|nr:UDP-N-acetyl-D-mannosamine dehydrogenase [Arthrobacter tumbae]MBM7782541.1 UDP-N-acetyl-D-mannosaminuronic acid dehydrogenase [Arthrobacter tumbae]
MNSIETVAVIGLGYIGLPTAAILATNGLKVTGVDINPKTVDAVNRGEVPFVEPDLSVHVTGAVGQGRLSASTETPVADAFIVAVPTPFKADKSADLTFIEAAARSIAPNLRGGELVILESTSPPGATQYLADYLGELRPDLGGPRQPLFAHCPERVLPGRVMIELVTNDRIVGGVTPEAAQKAKELYEVFCQGDIHLTDAVTAEMAKLVENSYRDVNIAFANELSMISDRLGIDVWELISLANHHPRVHILQPGPGVGGHCIAVDPWFIVDAVPESARIIRMAREVNDSKPSWVVEKVIATASAIEHPTIVVLGLTFKANIDDLRESPAVQILTDLVRRLEGAEFLVVEPHIEQLPKSLAEYRNVRLEGLRAAIEAADVVVQLVDHDDFRAMTGRDLDGRLFINTRGPEPIDGDRSDVNTSRRA